MVGYRFMGSNKELFNVETVTPEEKEEILRIVKDTLHSYLRNGKIPDNLPCPERLKKYAGIFVTLKKRGMLRGCIGFPYPVYPICRGAIEATIAASQDDPRFPPVSAGELDDVEVEVTLLGSPVRTDPTTDDFVKNFKIGQDGLIISRGGYSGLLLPQVALEEGFNIEEFLEATCLKAGLPRSAWKDPATEVYKFRGISFT